MKISIVKYLFGLVLCLGWLTTSGQNEEAQVQAEEIIPAKDTSHSVARATWLSTAFPGLGQAYNGSYWKMPIVYAGLGTTLYFAIDNHRVYREFLEAFYIRIDSNSTVTDKYDGIYNERQLIEIQNQFRKWRDLNIILTVVVYALNILDAHVDAHLHYYNVNEKLSMRWEPAVIRSPFYNSIGMKLKLDF